MRSSAPGASRIVRLSIWRRHRERDPAREVGLDQAGDDVDRRALRGEDHVDAGGARLLGEPDDRVLDVLALAHHQVGQLVDHDDDVGQPVGGVGAGLVERLDVAGGRAREPAVAVLHLAHGPLERGLGPLGLGDHRHQQVGQPVVARELDPLEVHQDHPGVVGGGVAQQARDQRVDHHALARARGARDQQVGHLGEVDGHRLAGDVAAEGERERASPSRGSRPRRGSAAARRR